MIHSPVELALLLLKLQNIIGSSLKSLDVSEGVRTNLISLSIGLSQVAYIALDIDIEGEPMEGVEI